jgi:hypothetical protein
MQYEVKTKSPRGGAIGQTACSSICFDARNFDRGLPSRFERGTAALVKRLKASWQEYRYEYAVRIVQPGLGSGKVDEEALHLLAATETYLFETRSMPPVIASA